ncbi:MAG: hypothetical protein HY836_15905 [Aquabacterium sp.]|uniref:hypothetical protein n=1 Tax=Aquabacterium sp. TaxID=1872578 RepID=UPI0025C2E1E3|nr:hypothetical protein [Aquabacterium sp.]MBI5927074.1 hypothetical protein [Aquabacterium sp.]
MIHHLARAFFVRNAATQGAAGNPPSDGSRPANAPVARPVKARPITPWGTPPARQQDKSASAAVITLRPAAQQMAPVHRVRISTDPSDARRTVITGRFAEVCAALDRLVMEQEAAA